MWTPEQEGALMAVQRWFRGPNRMKPFYLAGYAGTGKTTLARHFAENINGRVRFAAFTGKAASVLREKGCPGATTLHSLIYRPIGNTNAKRMKELETSIELELKKGIEIDIHKLEKWRRELDELKKKTRAMFELKGRHEAQDLEDVKLLILDECSMIDEQLRKDIESFGVPVLVLGDPGQLPPVGGRGGWATERPDYQLNEIHRQAKESKIIWFAHEIRQGRWPGYMESPDCVIRKKEDWFWKDVLEADQVITGKNATRHKLNKQIRKRKGFDKLYPLKGDKLICLKNDHEEGLLNGVTCEALADSIKAGQSVTIKMLYEGEEQIHHCDPGHFEENYFSKRTSFPPYEVVKHFDYGYAITGHKSQGSQWPTVLICDDRMRFDDREMRKKWLYTVVTRAESKLILYT